MKKYIGLLLSAFIIVFFFSCENFNLIGAAYFGVYTEIPDTPEPLTFAIVIAEGERLNLGAVKGGDPVDLLFYFFDASAAAHDVTAETIWAADPGSVASFDEPDDYPGRLSLHTPGDIIITAAYLDYPPETASVHINGPI
ncbi:MAG: hypothetical protein JW904_07650 [Spirochaetales bacterium]|nr:hypothetical protein [Spirochaetales bacterium]